MFFSLTANRIAAMTLVLNLYPASAAMRFAVNEKTSHYMVVSKT